MVVECNGKIYESIRAFCVAFDIKETVARERRRSGWSWEKIASTPIRAASVVIEYNGETYASEREFGDAFGLRADIVRARHKSGWSWERIATTPVADYEVHEDTHVVIKSKATPRLKIEIDGKIYNGIGEIATAFNLKVCTIKSRRRSGWSWERIVSTPLSESSGGRSFRSNTKYEMEYEGVTYESCRALATSQGVPYEAFRRRLQRGASVEDAILALKSRVVKDSISYNGNTYKSVTSLANTLGASVYILRNQLAISETVEAAVVKTRNQMIVHAVTVAASRKDVACARLQPGGKFVLVTCKVCKRNVMLPLDEVVNFVHSDNCERNEWLDM